VRSRLLVTAVVLMTVTSAISSCRSARRGVRVGAEAAQMEVTMVGIATEDAGKTSWIYELSGCLPPINGQLGANNTVSFTAIGLKAGLENCQMRIKSTQPSSAIKFVEGSEPNVLYWSRNMIISQNAAGKLIADASLQKLFENIIPSDARKTFGLSIPIAFSKAETEAVVTATLKCTPEIANIGRFTRIDATRGTVDFTLPIEVDIAYTCSELYINAGGVPLKYKGEFVGDAGKFTGSADKPVKLQSINVIAQNQVPTKPDGDKVKVGTTAAECNSDGKEFDVATGICK
jgi:hypothetical protein